MPNASPRLQARLAGFFYLIVIACGAFADAYVRQQFVVSGNAAQTASNILANPLLYRAGFVADLVPCVANVLLAVLFYAIFSVTSRRAASLVVLFTMVGTAIQAALLLFHLAPVLILTGSTALQAFTRPQLEALAYLCLRLHTNGYTIALVFFGCYGLTIGYLILRSTFLPKFIGVLMAIGGACYITNGVLVFIAPKLSSLMFLMPSGLAEIIFALWLTIIGVHAVKWQAQAQLQNVR